MNQDLLVFLDSLMIFLTNLGYILASESEKSSID